MFSRKSLFQLCLIAATVTATVSLASTSAFARCASANFYLTPLYYCNQHRAEYPEDCRDVRRNIGTYEVFLVLWEEYNPPMVYLRNTRNPSELGWAKTHQLNIDDCPENVKYQRSKKRQLMKKMQ